MMFERIIGSHFSPPRISKAVGLLRCYSGRLITFKRSQTPATAPPNGFADAGQRQICEFAGFQLVRFRPMNQSVCVVVEGRFDDGRERGYRSRIRSPSQIEYKVASLIYYLSST
jgi:hypothetical protein